MENRAVYLRICEELAALSKCVKHRVGALIVNHNRIVSTGVNGTAPGSMNCCDEVAAVDVSLEPHRSMHRKWSAMYEVHAEINAIVRAGRDAEGGTMYCTLEPCFDCLKAMLAAGIHEIYYAKKHKQNLDDPEVQNFITSQGVTVKHIYNQ